MTITNTNMGLGNEVWIAKGAGNYTNMVLFNPELTFDDDPKNKLPWYLKSVINRGAYQFVDWELEKVKISEGKVVLTFKEPLPGGTIKQVELKTLTEKDFKKHVLPTIDGFEKPKDIQGLRDVLFG